MACRMRQPGAERLPAAGRRQPAGEPATCWPTPATSARGTASRASRPTRRAAAAHVRRGDGDGDRAGARSSATSAACDAAPDARARRGRRVRDVAVADGIPDRRSSSTRLVTPEAVCRLGAQTRPPGSDGRTWPEKTPKGMRLHIGLFGRRNVGKSACSTRSRGSRSPSSPTWPARPPTRSRSRWSCCRSGRCCSSTPPASTTSARWARCACRRRAQVFDRTDVGVHRRRGGQLGRVRGRHPRRVRAARDARRRRASTRCDLADAERRRAGAPRGR